VVRVLLTESAGRVTITPQGSPPRVVAPTAEPGKLYVDGVPALSPIRFQAPSVFVDGGSYRGAVSAHRTAGGVSIVNEVPLEDYVAGTLHEEMYRSWGGAALRAQAVATRTYALYRMRKARGRLHDLDSTPGDQVYGGVRAETPAARRATRDTQGEYLAFQGRPILAVFHSTAGGRTASAEEVWGRALPYLVSREVPDEDLSPHSFWQVRVSPEELSRGLARVGASVGSVRGARVVEHTPSGRVSRVEISGSEAERVLSGRQVRQAVGTRRIKSTLYEVRLEDGSFLFLGAGYGHGVGMSQWGARVLARQGIEYADILARFYPGAELRELGAEWVDLVARGTGG